MNFRIEELLLLMSSEFMDLLMNLWIEGLLLLIIVDEDEEHEGRR